MKKIFLFSILAVGFIACDKDKFKTEPQVEVKSLSPDEVHNDEVFTFRAIVRDKEGDLKDSIRIVRKRFTPGVSTPLTTDTITYNLSTFGHPASSTIEVMIRFSYAEQREGFIFVNPESSDKEYAVGIIIHDKAGHKSEYRESKKILLKKI